MTLPRNDILGSKDDASLTESFLEALPPRKNFCQGRHHLIDRFLCSKEDFGGEADTTKEGS